jgi:hypothetical protein
MEKFNTGLPDIRADARMIRGRETVIEDHLKVKIDVSRKRTSKMWKISETHTRK